MWPQYQKDDWKDVNTLKEPTTAGRRLDVGGFILADSFETFLQKISKQYLEAAWNRLSQILERDHLNFKELSWSFFHPGETWIEGITTNSPLDYMGYSSRQLSDFDRDSRYQSINKELKEGSPSLCFASTWRSLKWKIMPDNYQSALRLLESMCLDEPTDWAPINVIKNGEQGAIWHSLAVALQNNDRERIEQLLQKAEITYSPLGYRILTKWFSWYYES